MFIFYFWRSEREMEENLVPMFIPLGLDTFQTCALYGCDWDAQHEFVAEIGLTKLFIGACDAHVEGARQVVEEIVRGITVPDLCQQKRINLEDVFISPPTYEAKCRLSLWESYMVTNPEDPLVIPEILPIRGKPRCRGYHLDNEMDARTVRAIKGWSWPLNRDRWRTAEGTLVAVSRIRLTELISAIQQIVVVNFQRVPRTLSWVKRLPHPSMRFIYPAVELAVGVPVSKDKLDDFWQEVRSRKLV